MMRPSEVVGYIGMPQVYTYVTSMHVRNMSCACMHVRNMSCVGGYACIPVAEIQCPIMDYTM